VKAKPGSAWLPSSSPLARKAGEGPGVGVFPPPPWGRARGGGKVYRLPTEADLAAYRAAEQALQAKRERLRAAWGMEPLPDEPIT
jgi:hypothetical protein